MKQPRRNKRKAAAYRLGMKAVDKADDPEPKSAHPSGANHLASNSPNNPNDYSTPNYGEAKGDGLHAGKNIAGVPDEFLKLFEHDPSEVIMVQSTKHPIGLVGIYGGAFLAIILIIATYSFFALDEGLLESMNISKSSAVAFGGLITLLLATITAVIAAVAGYVYKKSRLILTNQKVVYINYTSLIHRKISQLNIGEVEDVSVVQPTLIHRIFKTGNITIETAGEQFNYRFNYATDPYNFAHKTIQAHEGAIKEYGN